MSDNTTTAATGTTSEETAKTTGHAAGAGTSTASTSEGQGASQQSQTTQPNHTDAPDNQGGDTPRTFTQADVDRIVAARLEREQEKATIAANKAREEAERKAAEEQGNYQKLYEQEKALRESAEAERARIEREHLLDSIAAKHKLPDALRNRLQGETPEALEADAVELAKLVKAPAVTLPDIGAVNGGAAKPGVLDENRKAELAQRFRLPIPK